MCAVLLERALRKLTSSLSMSTVREAPLWYNLSNNFYLCHNRSSNKVKPFLLRNDMLVQYLL